MVICPRCESQVDETTRTTCPLCFTPLPIAGANPPGAPIQSGGAPPMSGYAPQPAPGAMPQSSYAPQGGGVPPLAPPDAMPPGVMPLNGPQGNMPAVQPLSSLSSGMPNSAPQPAANQRMTLTGEIIEAPQNMSSAPSAGNSQYSTRSYTAPRQTEKPKRSAPPLGTILLVLALLAGAGGGWYFWMHRTNPKDQAAKYLIALKAMDTKGMYETGETDPSKFKNEQDFVDQTDTAMGRVPGMKEMLTEMLSGLEFTAGEPKYASMTEATVPITTTGNVSITFLGQKKSQPVNSTSELKMKNFNGIWKVSKDNSGLGQGLSGSGDLTGSSLGKLGGK